MLPGVQTRKQFQIDEAWHYWRVTTTLNRSYTHNDDSEPDQRLARPWPVAVLSEEAAAARRGQQEGDEHQGGDGDEGQRHEDALVDGEQAHLPHGRTRSLGNGGAEGPSAASG